MNKVFEHFMADITVAEADVVAYYDELLREQQALETENPEQALSDYTNGMNYIQVIIPEGVGEIHYTKHILIGMEDADAQAITAAQQGGMEEAELQELIDAGLEKIKPLTDEVYDKVLAGEDFDALIEQYGTDQGMTVEPAKSEGYPVFVGSGTIPEFEEAAMALENPGDISEPVGAQFGYHILKLERIQEPGVIPVEDVRTLIEEELYYQNRRRSGGSRWRNGLIKQTSHATTTCWKSAKNSLNPPLNSDNTQI